MMFSGQQLLQQALAQHQAMQMAEGHHQQQQHQQQLLEAQAAIKPEQTPEQQYQDVFQRSTL